jgi:preprotein translocase subunit SecA
MAQPWHAARGFTPPDAPGMTAWPRRIGHALGMTRRRLAVELADVLTRGEALQGLDDAALNDALREIRAEVRLGRMHASKKGMRGLRPRALALLAELAERSLRWRPYRQQLMAALAMNDGLLVSLAAGEGKTLAAALAAILHAWRGGPCHVACANEYLAQRDAELMRPLFLRCGLSVAAVAQNMQPDHAIEAYRADVVYATGKQFLADFLRDQIILGGVDDPMRMRLREMSADTGVRQPAMRGLYAVIVDDAETVLFDEATTPVVISAPSDNPMLIDAVRAAHELVGHLQAGRDYRVLETRRDIEFTAAGEFVLDSRSDLLPPLWRTPERRDDLLRQAIVVRDLLQPQRHYVIQQARLTITDDYVGRLLTRPAWTHGLHQAIEIKEGLEPTPPSRVLARMSVAQFFQRYHQLGGIGVDLHAVRDEAWRTLGRLSLRIAARPDDTSEDSTHLCPPAILPDHAGKLVAFSRALIGLHRRGLPTLVSLRRISDAEAIARLLGEHRIKCQYFSTRQSAGVSDILQSLAQPGQISLTLNLDACGIVLPKLPTSETGVGEMPAGVEGGVAEIDARLELSERPGMRILQFDVQELSRQDKRILHLAGRHAQTGVARQYLALDDDLFRYYLPGWCRTLLHQAARRTPGFLPRIAIWMQRFAQYRAENQARRQRRIQPRREALLNQQLAFAGDRDMDVGAQQFGKH